MGMAIDPNGKTAYVTDYTRRQLYALLPVDLANRTVLRPIALPARFWAVSGVAFTPDGRMAYIAIGSPGTDRGTEVVPIRTATNTRVVPNHRPRLPAARRECSTSWSASTSTTRSSVPAS
jgi:DNA-binding beta-propeller fold protein YncE